MLKLEADFSLGELLYYLFFGIMLFSKGMGWYDGMPEYKICLVIGVFCLILKLLLDKYTLWECLLIGVFKRKGNAYLCDDFDWDEGSADS